MSGKSSHRLDSLFNPKSIAVIGASNTKLKWGYIVPANIVVGGYDGPIYPVNPHESNIQNREAYKTIEDVPGDIDLAVITTPAPTVPDIIKGCARKGVRNCLVISGGFSEIGAEGAALEKAMAQTAKDVGMRIIGPNTMGIFSASSSLHALMPPVKPVHGRIGFAAQSGNLGTQVLSLGKALGVGFSRFVCIGNEADLKCADYIEYFESDPDTQVILLYLEGVHEARRFVEIAKRVSPKKPIVIMKAGKTEAGAKAARSHTGALAGNDSVFAGVIKQTGMIEADDTEAMLDIAKAFAALPLPRGRRVGVLTWGGGWGVVTTDALDRHGFELSEFPEETMKELDSILPPYWSKGNPVDLVGTLDLSMHLACVKIIARCPTVDAVLTLGTMGAISSMQSFVLEGSFFDDMGEEGEEAEVIAKELLNKLGDMDNEYREEVLELIKETDKPIIAVSLPTSSATSPVLAQQSEVVIYPSPERGVKTLSALDDYRRFLQGR